jgi:hypothetical protein
MKGVLDTKDKQINDMKTELEKYRKEKPEFIEDRAALQKLFQTASKAAMGGLYDWPPFVVTKFQNSIIVWLASFNVSLLKECEDEKETEGKSQGETAAPVEVSNDRGKDAAEEEKKSKAQHLSRYS